MAAKNEEILIPLLSAADQVNYFLVAGGLLAATITIAKLFASAGGRVEFLKVSIPVVHAWLPIGLVTAFHIYFSWWMLHHTAAILACGDRELSGEAWHMLRGGKVWVMANMAERSPTSVQLFGGLSAPWEVSFNDLLMIVHVGLAVLVLLATIAWRSPARWPVRTITTVIALLLVLVNWWAGSQWALLASDLSRQANSEPLRARTLGEEVRRLAPVSCPMRRTTQG